MNQIIFMKRIRSILSDNACSREIPFQRQGEEIDYGSLALLPTGEKRIFSKVEDRLYRKYTIGILMDVSGSMEGIPLQYACLSSHAIAYALYKCGVEILVAQFNGCYRDVSLAEIADLRTYAENSQKFKQKAGGTNADACAVYKLAVTLLKKAPIESQKFIFVLSDEAATSMCRDFTHKHGFVGKRCLCQRYIGKVIHSTEMVARVASHIRYLGVEVFSIRMVTDNPYQYGKSKSVDIHQLTELYPKMVSLLERNFRRG